MVRSSVELARAGRAGIHRHRARGDLQRHIVQRLVAAIVFADPGDEIWPL